VPEHLLAAHLHFAEDAITALDKAHALVVLTEWDEFRDLDFTTIYQRMFKPAFAFDGRSILPAAKLRELGFELYCIGQG
jgi:UDPglucose 6-dehydrogenase